MTQEQAVERLRASELDGNDGPRTRLTVTRAPSETYAAWKIVVEVFAPSGELFEGATFYEVDDKTGEVRLLCGGL